MKNTLTKIKDFMLILLAGLITILVIIPRLFSKDNDTEYIALTQDEAHVDMDIENLENEEIKVEDLTPNQVEDFWKDI